MDPHPQPSRVLLLSVTPIVNRQGGPDRAALPRASTHLAIVADPGIDRCGKAIYASRRCFLPAALGHRRGRAPATGEGGVRS
jgi:hypothetical protein